MPPSGHGGDDTLSSSAPFILTDQACEVLTLKYGERDDDLEEVPGWALNQNAMRVERKEFGAFVVGPAVLVAYKASVVTGAVWILTPLIAYLCSACEPDGVARVPVWFYALPLTPIMYSMQLEWEVRSYTVIPQLIRTRELKRRFKVLTRGMPFQLWLFATMVMSLSAHSDLVTTGVFVGKALATDGCPPVEGVPSMDRAWGAAMRTSPTLSWLRGIPFSFVPIFGWLLMCVQGVYALLSTPKCASDIYNTINPGRKLGEHFEFVQSAADPAMMSFDTPLGHRLNMWVTVQATAELSRMVSVTNQSLTYTEALGKKSPAILSLYIGAEASRRVLSFCAYVLLEGAYHLNAQSAGLALFKAMSGPQHECDMQTLFSIVLSLIVTYGNLMMAASRLYFFHAFITEHSIEDMARDYSSTPTGSFEHAEAMIRSSYRSVRIACLCGVGLGALTLLFAVRATVQTYMAVVCPQGLHNTFGGCVAF